MKHFLRLLVVLAGIPIMVSACNMPGISPELNPESPIGASPSPLGSEAGLPSPSPTTPPEVNIGAGDQGIHNGDWESAIIAFQQTASDPGASPDTIGTARLGLAEATLRQGNFSEAVTQFNQFLTDYPGHPETAKATYLRGDARMGIADWSGAISDFNAYLLLRPGIIDSYVYERIADCQMALGDTDAAMVSYGQAFASERYSTSVLQLREKVATLLRQSGRPDGAIEQYRAILDVAQNSAYRATIEYEIGQTFYENQRFDEAYTQFNSVFMTYPDRYEAWLSLKTLRDDGIDVDQYQRGIVNFHQANCEVSVEAFVNYWAANRPQVYTPESYLYISKCYRMLGNSASALTELQVFLDRFQPATTPLWYDGLIETARAYTDLGDLSNAIATYDRIIADYPAQPQAADAAYEAASIAIGQGDLERASAYYVKLAELFPSDSRSADGLFELGYMRYQAGDLTGAEQYFRLSTQLLITESAGKRHYWLGKTLVALGRPDEANAEFGAASAADGATSYYSIRSVDFQVGRDSLTPPVSFNIPQDLDIGRAEAEQWLVERFTLIDSPPLAAQLRGDITGKTQFARAQELWKLGLLQDARQDFETVRTELQDDPLATYQLSVFFRDIGLYRSSIIAAGRLLRLAQVTPLQAPTFLAKLRYPTYFDDLVLAKSIEHNLDPLLVYSLIWQESVFEGFATSTASAQGLMQIWPPTGEDIAARLNWPNYTPADLQRPTVSVTFGTWLLEDELKRFEGNKYAALAAYNAGPGRSAAWVEASGGDSDAFVEAISISEPRTYIERITEIYAMYSAIYGVK